MGDQHRPSADPEPVGFGRILAYFLKLGAIGFGGPIATVGYMQRDLVEQRQWIDRQDFLDGLALGQTMPGRGCAIRRSGCCRRATPG